MTSAPRLLDQLANLTSIRDLELMEISLLKTLNGFLRPRSLSLIRINGKGEPVREVVYGTDRCAMLLDNLDLSTDLKLADEYLRATQASMYSSRTEQGVLVVFALTQSRAGRNYLQLTVTSDLSKPDIQLTEGVLQIYRNFVNLMQHSQTDQLTGLANRKTFDECVAKVHELIPHEIEPVANERRSEQPMNYWLVMVDIDHFKLVNDRFGHLYGDEVLVLLAQLMQVSFREDDMVFRFGGEEFVLIVRCADKAACETTLERFRTRVEQRSIPQVGNVTISMGITRMERQTFAATMVDHADQALYYSKRNGRNRATFFEDLVAMGLVQVENIKTDEISFF